MSEPPSVAVLVLNWNNYEDSSKCLRSLRKLEYEQMDVLLIDNNSSDQSGSKLKREFPWVKYIQADKNLGFAGGMNVGLRREINNYDYFLMLNNDTIVNNGLIKELISVGESRPDIGILSPLILDQDSGLIHEAGREFEKWTLLFRNHNNGKHPDDMHGVRNVNSVSGCCMLIKRELIKDVGYFSESFFFGGEDVEICMRAKNNGWKIAVDTDCSISHKVSSTAGDTSPFYTYQSTKNKLILGSICGYKGSIGMLVQAVLNVIFIVNHALAGSNENIRPILLGYYDFLTNNYNNPRLCLLNG